MRYLYSLILALALPLAFLRLWVRSWRLPAYRLRWLERLGIFADPQLASGGIWIHAVSVGEVVAAIPLIKALLQQYPQLPITVTTTTPTGSARVRQSFGEQVFHVYLPYDLPILINNFLRKIRPSKVIIMETELWPNVLYVCHQQQIPVVIANARLSDKSFRNYAKIRWLLRPILAYITFIAAQTQQDLTRFLALGVDQNKLHVTGNLKFDIELAAPGTKLAERLVLVAASTHAGEEQIVLDIYKNLKLKFANLLLVLVPRHPDRFAAVEKLIAETNLKYVLRSSGKQPSVETDVWLGDSMGELNYFYSIADIAFVGGSLVPIGGHNLLEPAAHGISIITGSQLANFREISAKLSAANAVIIVQHADELTTELQRLCEKPALRQTLGHNAQQVLVANRGALQKLLNLL